MTIRMQDFPDHDIVIAGGDYVDTGAFESSQNVVEQRHPGMSGTPFDAFKTVVTAAGETIGEGTVRGPQDVDAEVFADPEMLQDAGPMIHADQHQRRSERNRGEGVSRHAVRRAAGVPDRCDGDSAGEFTADTAEMLFLDFRQGLLRLTGHWRRI